jgi:hypothetical protein
MKWLILFVPSICFAGDWTTTDTAWQAAYTTVLVADCAQTRYGISNQSRYYETNNYLPKYPSKGMVDNVCLVTGISHAIVSYFLPQPWRRVWQVGAFAIEINVVAHNKAIGMRMEF